MKKSLLPFCLIFLVVFSSWPATRHPSPLVAAQPHNAVLVIESRPQPQNPEQSSESSTAPNLRFDCSSAADGLSFSLATSILQDQQGFMWFGTRYGLNKYDGFNFAFFRLQATGDVLFANYIRDLYQDRAGDLWISNLVDLVRRDRETGEFVHYQYDPANFQGLGPGQIYAIGEDAAGTLWVGTTEGLNRFDPSTETFTRYLPTRAILSFLTDRQGDVWLGTDLGLWHYASGSLGQLAPEMYQHDPSDSDSLSNDLVMSLFEDGAGSLWIGTWGGGLNRLDRATGKITRFQHNPEDRYSLSDNFVESILEDSTGRLWIGTNSGLNLFDPTTDGFFQYHYVPGDSHSLNNNVVQDLYQDRSGVLWIATLTGICKVNETASRFTHYQQGSRQPDEETDAQPGDLPGLSDNMITSVYQDGHGILWIGTSTGGLNRLDRSTGSVTVFQNAPNDPTSFSAGEVDAIYEDRMGTLWIGTSDGLVRFTPQTGTFEAEEAFQGRTVASIIEDQQSNLWVGYWSGVKRRDAGASDFAEVPAVGKLLANDRLVRIYPDRTGAVWISTQNHGLFRLDPVAGVGESEPTVVHLPQDANDPKSPGNSPVTAFFEDTHGTLWMGTVEDGLVRFDRDSQTFTHYLPNTVSVNYVSCIQGDAQGNLWMSTKPGLARFDPRSETFAYFDARDGLKIGEGLGSCFQNKQGEMFFGSMQGLNVFWPDQIRDNPNAPTVVITALNLNNQPLRTDLLPNEQVELSYQENYLSFDFSALDYTAPAKNQYAYQMEGLDAHWIEAGTRRHADYPDLQPGTYTFRVKASNNSGVWNEQGAAVRITIMPPFWQTWWFLGIVAALMILGVAGAYRLRVRNIEMRSLALEEQVRERTSEIEHRRQEMEALYQADEELYRHLHLDDVLQALVDIAIDILHADKGTLLVWDENREYLIPRASHGFKPLTLTNMKLKPGMGIAGKVAVSGKPFMVEDTLANPDVSHQITDPEGIRSFMQVPIQIKGETFGVFSADFVQPRTFKAQEQRLLIAFAQRAALAIQNAQAYQQEQEMAVLEERSRLARELHDAVTQTLFSASLVAEALPTTWENDPQEGRGLLQELRGLSRGALAEMRTLLLELRPAALVETRLEDLLRQLGEAASGREGIPISVQVEGMAELPPDVQIAFYRITQEALNNIVKHARAHQASVRLCYHCEDQPATSHTTEAKQPQATELSVLLSISDDGRGFDSTQITHDRLGLGIMQERAQAIGATLTIESQPGHGTRVNVLWKQAIKQETP